MFAGGGPLTSTEYALIQRLGLEKQIISTSVDRGKIKWLLSNAIATLIPSISEGFCLPIIESLACKTPVFASDIEAHREVGGEWINYISAQNALEWRYAIENTYLFPRTKATWDDPQDYEQYKKKMIYYENERMIQEHCGAYSSL